VPVPSAPDVLVLVALRLTGLAEPPEVSARTGVPEDVVGTLLDAADATGTVRYREGSFHGWALTPDGRRHVEQLLAAELDEAGLRGAVIDSYGRFKALNTPLLELCTRWQLRDVGGQPVVNDHADADYDRSCVEQLAEHDAKAEPIVSDLAEVLARFSGYPRRLREAVARVEGGELDWFTSPTVDSYHTVWFELHEHLLATLGIERSSEPTTTGSTEGSES
jgi:hypothetical protein